LAGPVPHSFGYCPPISKLRAASSGAQPRIYNDVFHHVKQLLKGTRAERPVNPDAHATFRIVGTCPYDQ